MTPLSSPTAAVASLWLAHRTTTAAPPGHVSALTGTPANSSASPGAREVQTMRSPFAPNFTSGAAAELATALRVLGCPSRLLILSLMYAHAGAMSAARMVEPLGTSQPTVSYHLRILENAGLIRRRYDGRYCWCTLDVPALAGLADLLAPRRTSRSADANIEAPLALDVTTPFSHTFNSRAAADLATVLKGLAYPSRLVILSLIHSCGAMTETQIIGQTGGAEKTIGHHVRTLGRVSLIHSDQVGTSRWFTLNETALAGLASALRPAKRRVRA
jgi:ArsR family transcriptional regulator, arsenate/arsenite/antimonite-responsive transcriptional repressor